MLTNARRASRIELRALGLAIATAVAVHPSLGQAPGDATHPVLRLGAVLNAVERSNPRITAARAIARASAASVPGASRFPDPQFQLGWMNYELPQFRQMSGIGMTQLQVMQMVPTGGKLRFAGQVEAAHAEAAAARVADASFDVRTRTAMAFYDLYAADNALNVLRETRRLEQDLATISARMYEVGDGRQVDVLRANVEVARMDEDIVRVETMRSVTRSRLNALLVQADDTPLGVPELPVFPQALPSIDSLARLAEAHRPMILAGVGDVEAAKASEELAARAIWPDLQVGVQLGRQSGADGPQQMGSLMLGVSLPLYARSRQYAMRDEEGAMREMAAADLAALRAETRGAVAEAYANVSRARRLAAFYRASVLPQAAATATSSLTAYQSGTVNFMTVLDAQMNLNRFRQELFTLEAEEGSAWAELEMLTGQVLVNVNDGGSSK